MTPIDPMSSPTCFDLRKYLLAKIGPPHSLRRTLISVMGGLTLGILILIEISVAYFTYRTESNAWRGRQHEAAYHAAQSVGQFIQHAKDSLALVNAFDAQFLQDHPAVVNYVFHHDSALQEIILLDAQGNILASAFHDRPVLVNLFTIPQSQWFQEARRGRDYFSNVQISASNEPYLILSLPTRGEGVIAARMSMEALQSVFSRAGFGREGRVYLVNQSGDIVVHSDREIGLANIDLSGRPEYQAAILSAGSEWLGEYRNFQGIRMVGVAVGVAGTDWIIFTELPYSEAFATTRLAVILLGGELLLSTVLAYWVTTRILERQVFEPAERLRDGARHISQGNLGYRIGLNRQDEIGQVADAFDEMAVQLSKRAQQIENEIAERKQIEENLRISEARYRAIVEDQTELICRWKPDGTLTFVNEAYCRYFGKSREELLGVGCEPFIVPEDLPITDRQLGLISPENPAVTYEHRVTMPDGSIRWQSWTDRAIFDEHGKVIEFVSVGQDVTERNLSRLALQKKTLQQEKLIEIAHKLTTSLDIEQVYQQIGKGALQMLNGFSCTLYLLEANAKTLVPVVTLDELYQQQIASTTIDVDSSFSGQAVKARQCLIFNDAANDERGFQIPGTPENEPEHVLTVPLMVKDKVLGVLCLRRYDQPFDEVDLAAAEVFASYASTALANSQAHYQLQIEIAERRRAEEALRASEIELRKLNEALEERVRQRTAELSQANLELTKENAERRKAEEIIRASLQEKEVLLKEIHHRVKNNLQVISSLLSLQARRVQDPVMLELLEESQTRVRSMALIHEKLYQSSDLSRVDFSDYIRNLIAHLMQTYNHHNQPVTLNLQTEGVLLSIDRAVPCALLLNELVSNSLKHAFPDERSGEITVQLKQNQDKRVSLVVSDNGVGIPENIDWRNPSSLGLQLVSTLVGQMDGTIELERKQGTCFRIEFSLQKG